LLRALAGEITPDSGSYKKHVNAHLGYLGQSNINRLESDRTIVEELLTVNQVGEQQARSVAGSLLFSGDLAYKRIEVLSGGEKARVNLGKILLTPVNVLLLDEPTNHLDYESVQALMNAVDAFDGAVIFVTHDERFLQTIAKKLIVFDGGAVKGFDGTYDQFLTDVGFASEAEEVKSTPLEKALSEATERKKSNKELQKLLRPLKRQLKDLEKEIEKLEHSQSLNKDFFTKAYQQGNKLKMETLGIEYQSLQTKLEEKMKVWDELAEQIAPLEAQ
jgi:ATP-binding cassette subfamily F protein 3